MKPNLFKRLVCACLLLSQLLISSTVFAKSGGGAIAGGGGDAFETRVDEIRADILKWINDGGAKNLSLPNSLTYDVYETKMKEVLAPQFVVVGFVEKDDQSDEELQVSVDGKPKTCRGFISNRDSKFHIICNIPRFEATSEEGQYKLIHHEFAGLVNVENNLDAASDYLISNQLTDYLSMQTVLKLAVKTDKRLNHTPAVIALEKRKYIGNSLYEVEMRLKDNTNIFQVILNNYKSQDPLVKRIVLDRSNDFSYKTTVPRDEILDTHDLIFRSNTVQYTDSTVESLPEYRIESETSLDIKDIYNKRNSIIKNVINYKIVSDIPTPKKKFEYVSLKTFKTSYEIRFDSSKVDFSDVRGVIIYKNGKFLEELMSEKREEIEQFLQSKVIKDESNYVQLVKGVGPGCGEVSFYDQLSNESASCKNWFFNTSKYYRNDNEMEYALKFIVKGNSTKVKFSTLKIPSLHPKKEADKYERDYEGYYLYRNHDDIYKLNESDE